MTEERVRPRVRLIKPDYQTKTRPVPEEMLRDLESRYEGRGVRYGRIFHMSPMDALEFAEDAGQVGIGILGPEYWFTLSHEYQASPDYSQMLNTDNCVRRSIQRATDDIINALPDGVVWVSFVLAIPLSDEGRHI